MSQTWRTLWPADLWTDQVLVGIDEYLADPATQAELRHADAHAEYPARQLAELRRRGVAALFAEAPGEPSRVTFPHLCALNALTASWHGSLAVTLGVNALGLLPVYVAASPALRAEVFAAVRAGSWAALALTEQAHGSDVLRNEARARRSADGLSYRLSGEKYLINGGSQHDLVLALLRTRPADGTDSGLRATQDFTVFLLERGCGLRPGERYHTLPVPAADISGIRLDGAEVGVDRIVGREGDGFAVVQKTLAFSRGGVSCFAAGVASRAVALAMRYARDRSVYGAPIATLAPIADHLLRAWSCDLAASAMSVKQAAACNALGLAAAHLTAVAKLCCCDLAERAVREAAAVLGARALLTDLPFHALLRDVWLFGVFDGTRHVMLEQIQQRLPQLLLREQDAVAHDPRAATAIYRAPARRLVDVARMPSRVWLCPSPAQMRALAAMPGAVDLAPLAEIASALLASVAAARHTGAWERDAGLRFDAAQEQARLEAVVAMVELGDPDRRGAAVGPVPAVSWGEAHAARYRYAVAWHALELGQAVQVLALRAGAQVPALAAALAGAAHALDEARPAAAVTVQ